MTAAETWKSHLQSWAIPSEILDQAPVPPWMHPVDLFKVNPNFVPTRNRSDEVAAAALSDDKSVLDIGCGGGRAAFALLPDVRSVVGIDHQQAMLDEFTQTAKSHDLPVQTVLGDWPEVASQTPSAEVVVCHHVFYNVQDLVPFVQGLSSHATRRVVVEIPVRHPMSDSNPAWEHFWNLQRPTNPTAELALEVVREAGFNPSIEYFEDTPRIVVDPARAVELMRIRLCLTADRDAEIAEFMATRAAAGLRQLATIWWDV